MDTQTQSKLRNVIKLSHRVTIYVPSRNLTGALLKDRSGHVTDALEFLTDKFGGATATEAVGYWRGAAGILIPEDVTLVFAYAKELTSTVVDEIVQFVETKKSSMGQESVAIEIDGEMYII